ncbi:hypothetical protein C4375_07280 [Devosia sp. I507]|nr:hypothetical protein C4375_07280 [Devosia sp. I507]
MVIPQIRNDQTLALLGGQDSRKFRSFGIRVRDGSVFVACGNYDATAFAVFSKKNFVQASRACQAEAA